MFKVDIFVPQDTPFARENMRRRIALEVPEIGRTLYVCAPEDIVLHKLLWYAAGAVFRIASGMTSRGSTVAG